MSSSSAAVSSSDTAIGKGVDMGMLMMGVAAIAAGIVLAGLGFGDVIDLRIRRIPIPLEIVGPLVAVIGVGVVVFAMRQLKCLSCNKTLKSALAWFRPQDERVVVDSLRHGQVGELGALEIGSPGETGVQAEFHYCDTCKQVARIEVQSWTDSSSNQVVPETELRGANVRALVTELIRRGKIHEERYEES